MKTIEQIEKEVRRIVLKNIDEGSELHLDNDQELIKSRILSSLSIINIISELEEVFNIEHSLDEFDLTSFSTINKIVETELNILGVKNA